MSAQPLGASVGGWMMDADELKTGRSDLNITYITLRVWPCRHSGAAAPWGCIVLSTRPAPAGSDPKIAKSVADSALSTGQPMRFHEAPCRWCLPRCPLQRSAPFVRNLHRPNVLKIFFTIGHGARQHACDTKLAGASSGGPAAPTLVEQARSGHTTPAPPCRCARNTAPPSRAP